MFGNFKEKRFRLHLVVLIFCLIASTGMFVAVPAVFSAGTDYIIRDDLTPVWGDGRMDIDGDGDNDTPKGGDRLLIPYTRTRALNFRELEGDPGNPIIITNYGGTWMLDLNNNEWCGIALEEQCNHVRVTGTGDPELVEPDADGVKRGIKIFNSTNKSVSAYENSQGIEIDHIEANDTLSVGSGEGETLVGFKIHHNYIHNAGAEGLYIGSSFYGTSSDSILHEVEIHENRIESCGWDGIQVGSAKAEVKVHHNYIRDCGFSESTHSGNTRAGLILNHGTTGNYYNNMIINSGVYGVYIQGIGGYTFYNNVIVNSGRRGIQWWFGGDKNDLFYNNTIIGFGEYGIWISSGGSGTGAIYDNIIAGSGIDGIHNENINVSKYNNLESSSIDMFRFVNPGKYDFHLTLTSTDAIDKGSNTGFAPFDFDDISRPQGFASDIGAFEYQATSDSPSLKQLLLNWLTSTLDQNGDGKVNGVDFGRLVAGF